MGDLTFFMCRTNGETALTATTLHAEDAGYTDLTSV